MRLGITLKQEIKTRFADSSNSMRLLRLLILRIPCVCFVSLVSNCFINPPLDALTSVML
ncbi:hypothetical protein KSP39_PZI014497 [Platanthera zijinensis]|uniref:Uncharacterized protein n=1 Tax=Platanthera zijinensis TaxID=2320716 RepID=A0AAP0G2Q0_9ASPA